MSLSWVTTYHSLRQCPLAGSILIIPSNLTVKAVLLHQTLAKNTDPTCRKSPMPLSAQSTGTPIPTVKLSRVSSLMIQHLPPDHTLCPSNARRTPTAARRIVRRPPDHRTHRPTSSRRRAIVSSLARKRLTRKSLTRKGLTRKTPSPSWRLRCVGPRIIKVLPGLEPPRSRPTALSENAVALMSPRVCLCTSRAAPKVRRMSAVALTVCVRSVTYGVNV